MPSEKVLSEKKTIVAALAEKIKASGTGVLVDYKGLTVAEDTELRKALRAAGVEYAVVKNTLTRFALKEAGYEGLDEVLNGTTSLALAGDDVVAPAKVICKFAKDHGDKISVKGGFIEGKVVPVEDVIALSKVPSKEDLISKTLYCILSPLQGLAIALQAIADKKNEGAEAPAAEAAAE